MLMMCWFYCIPFAKGFFFALAPLTFLLALFVLKRGIRQSRKGLRQFAFVLMFLAFLKLCTVDIYLLREYVMCAVDKCHDTGFFQKVQGAGLVVLVLFSLFLFNLYRSFAQDRRQKSVTPEQVHLSLWANLSIMLVMLLIFWLAAPWVGYLTVGHMPDFFMQVPWQNLAMLNVFVLLIGFWKLEDCLWGYQSTEKTKKQHQINVWTAKDTLWVSVALLVITLAFSYASNDVLSTAMPQQSAHFELDLDKINLEDIFGGGFKRPE
jgi:hypothetical protein